MSDLHNSKDYCPYCGELIELLVDCTLAEQCYIEDCSVCCRPIVINVTCFDDAVEIRLSSEDD